MYDRESMSPTKACGAKRRNWIGCGSAMLLLFQQVVRQRGSKMLLLGPRRHIQTSARVGADQPISYRYSARKRTSYLGKAALTLWGC